MMKINPAITLQAWRLGYSFRDPAILDRYSLDRTSGLAGEIAAAKRNVGNVRYWH
jgi:hypothetical protein